MKKQRYKLTSKIVSVIMSILFIALSIPFAFAAEPTVLTEANIAVWPTFEGEMYYGQKLSESNLTIQGGTVTTDGTTEGTVIEGYFEFVDLEYRPTALNNGASLRFVPKDSENYTGFETLESTKAIYKVLKTTPVLVDPINNPPVATKVSEAGKRLMTTTISGGALMNPYTKEVIEDAVWGWSKKTTKVNESGYFTATSTPVNYNTISMDIYVGIEGDTEETTVTVVPTFDGEIFYAPDLTWGDLTLVGGSAVIKSTNTPIDGTFAVVDTMKDKEVKVGENTIDVRFTPADETLAMASICQVSVTVNKAVPAFKTDDESGVPTITMPYGTKLDSSLDYKIKPLVDVGVPVSLAYKDLDGNNLSYSGTTPVVGTHEIQVRVNIDNTNYEQFTMLTFNLEITGFTANCIMVPVGTEGYKIIDQNLAYNATKPTGTYTVSYTIDGEKQPDITVRYEELFKIDMTKSGKYEYSIKYNEIENDPFEIDSFTFSSEEKLDRNVKIGDSIQQYTYGDKVTAVAPATDPSMPDKPYYGFAGWEAKGIELTDEQISSPEITFDMPDEDVELNATYKFSMKLFFEWIWQQIVQFFTFFINAMKDLFALSVA